MKDFKENKSVQEMNDAEFQKMIDTRVEQILEKTDKVMERAAETLAESSVFSKDEILELNRRSVEKQHPELAGGFEGLRERDRVKKGFKPSFKGWSQYDSTIESKKYELERDIKAGREVAAENRIKEIKELEKKKQQEAEQKKREEEAKKALKKL